MMVFGGSPILDSLYVNWVWEHTSSFDHMPQMLYLLSHEVTLAGLEF